MNEEDFKQDSRLAALPQYVGGIRKRRFISLVRLSVHTNPATKLRELFENAPQPKECENAVFAFRCGQKFRKR